MQASNPNDATGLHPTARPAEKRKDIEFSSKDVGLRQDVHDLGIMLGEVVREQGGDELFNAVETARKNAIERREGDVDAGRRLDALVRSLSVHTARDFIRAFSTYFQVVNTAEQVHRIRRRRDYLKDASKHQPGGIEDTVFKLKDIGMDLTAVDALLQRMHIEPVFTGHPTEPARRTVLRKQQNIVRRLVDMQNPALTPQEQAAAFESIRADVTATWQTEETPREVMTVFDELEHVLFFLTDIIYRAVPVFYETLEDSLKTAYGADAEQLRVPTVVSFASWIGGDMEVHPDITGRTVRETLARQRSLVLDLYFRECRELSNKLSQSTSRIGVAPELVARIHTYSGHFPEAAGQVPVRHRNMPYRMFLKLVMARLQSTYDDDVFPYESPEELLDDIQLIADSLKNNRGRYAGLFSVRRLLRRIETFGFHLLTLDIRQNALVNREVVGRCLGEDNWLDESPEYRAARIHTALERNESPIGELDNNSKRALAIFQAIAFCRRKYGRRAIGPYVVSMAHGIDDVLSVKLMARWGDLRRKSGAVPLDIAPFFETVEDLQDCGATMRALFNDPLYREHLQRRDNQQIAMVSYSDSNKDEGLAGARWSLQQAQSDLVDVLNEAGVDLILCHGRGGTISRGGGKTHAAVLGSPPGAVRGQLRATEQGELVKVKYGIRGIALRTLEQALGSVALATAFPRATLPKEAGEWHEMVDTVAAASRERYRSLVYDAPDFFRYFQLATPVELIERMQQHAGHEASRSANGASDLRAVPWDFAWTQSRHGLPGWYGFGTGLAKVIADFGLPEVQEMSRTWYFFRALLSDVETVLAKSDLNIANRYSRLAGDLHERFFPLMRGEFDLTVEKVLEIKEQQVLLEKQSTLRRSIRLRNPYVDPMSLLQVDLLKRWRESGKQDEVLFQTLVASINGIARGLQDSG
jgi:phosphoenolpyruvate carboxylase